LKGSLHFYKDPLDAEVAGTIELKTASISDDPKKKFNFIIKTSDDEVRICANDENDFAKWVSALKASCGKDPAPPIPKEKVKKSGGGFAFGMQKKAGSIMATSKVGNAALKKALPEELTGLLDALTHLIAKKNGEGKAVEIRHNITKILMKAYFQIEKKNLTMDDFMVAYKPLRESFEILVKINDNYTLFKPETLDGLFDKASGLLQQVEKQMEKLLLPHLKPQNMFLMKQTLEFLSSTKFLRDVWGDEALRDGDDLFELSLAMSKFNSFHFYK